MPPKWPRKPDRADPAYRKLEDRLNFAVHVAAFTAFNSSLWFYHNLVPGQLGWLPYFTLPWTAALFSHGVWAFAIASYAPKSSE